MNQREFIKLQVASFISQMGSHFMTLALSAMVLHQTGSPAKASLVFVLSYLPSVFISSRLGSWIDIRISRSVFIANELIAMALTVGVGISFDALPALLYPVIALRSTLLFSSRTISSKWIKLISEDNQQESRIRVSFLVFFLATAASGLLASATLHFNSIWFIIGVDLVTYLVGISVINTLRDVATEDIVRNASIASTSFLSTARSIIKHPDLSRPFMTVVGSQTIFQGAYFVLVNYLPIQRFNMGVTGTGIFQIAASAGIIGGFILVWKFGALKHGSAIAACILGASAGLFCSIVSPLPVSLVAFWLMNLLFECLWLQASTAFFVKCPKERLGRFQFTMQTAASVLMAGATFFYALILEFGGNALFGVTVGILLVAQFIYIATIRGRFLKAVGEI